MYLIVIVVVVSVLLGVVLRFQPVLICILLLYLSINFFFGQTLSDFVFVFGSEKGGGGGGLFIIISLNFVRCLFYQLKNRKQTSSIFPLLFTTDENDRPYHGFGSDLEKKKTMQT